MGFVATSSTVGTLCTTDLEATNDELLVLIPNSSDTGVNDRDLCNNPVDL